MKVPVRTGAWPADWREQILHGASKQVHAAAASAGPGLCPHRPPARALAASRANCEMGCSTQAGLWLCRTPNPVSSAPPRPGQGRALGSVQVPASATGACPTERLPPRYPADAVGHVQPGPDPLLHPAVPGVHGVSRPRTPLGQEALQGTRGDDGGGRCFGRRLSGWDWPLAGGGPWFEV